MKTAFSIWLATAALLSAGTLTFDTALKEIDAPADAKTVAAEFPFTNKSKDTVTIKQYESTCSCMSAKIKDGKLRYAPGESGVVRAEFDMGNFSGDVDKVVAIWLGDDRADNPSIRLTTRVHIPVLVSIEPKTVKWEIGGDASPKTIKITMNHDKPIHVLEVQCSNDNYGSELKTIEKGKSYELVVSVKDGTQPGLGIFTITTDCDVPKHRSQQAFVVSRKPTPAEAAAAATR
ncbi:MAG: DUF1573 domain-containing protein [Akkermansiaceae bacterium]|nr:DUF1573 domain-containing protein [Akkermansiaceae bacterium]MCP5543996.1 DUF1573 domain-containing protein [Akkermansiaceae bacterium]